jgi:Domain of unknown function (DUF4124)
MQRTIFLLAAAVFALSGNAFADGKKIVKWVDSKGVTHYGDKLPAQEAGRKNAEMNAQGMVLKQNNLPVSKGDVANQQKLELERKDKILLASYTKTEEIDLARDRNLQMDLAAVQSLEQQKISAETRAARNNKTAEGFKARNKPVPPYLVEELKLSKSESTSIDKQLTQRKLAMEATKERYAEEKIRFIALKQPTAIDSIASSLDTVIAENPTAAGAQPIEPVAKK